MAKFIEMPIAKSGEIVAINVDQIVAIHSKQKTCLVLTTYGGGSSATGSAYEVDYSLKDLESLIEHSENGSIWQSVTVSYE